MKLTHADGTSEYVTLERADNPVEAGTPLNKKTLLTDETAEMLGMDDSGTVNDALERIILSSISETASRTELDDVQICGGIAATNGWTTVTFPFAFPKAPAITVTVEVPASYTGVYVAQIANATEKSFQVIVRTASGNIQQLPVRYIAFYDGGATA